MKVMAGATDDMLELYDDALETKLENLPRPYQKGGKFDWALWKTPYWRLDPQYYHSLIAPSSDMPMAAYHASKVLRGMIPFVMIRRTQVSGQIII